MNKGDTKAIGMARFTKGSTIRRCLALMILTGTVKIKHSENTNNLNNYIYVLINYVN